MERKHQLCWTLEDKASEFYSRQVERDPGMDYFDILDRMEKRFDLKDLPETAHDGQNTQDDDSFPSVKPFAGT